jgi:chromosome segregation ATPase
MPLRAIAVTLLAFAAIAPCSTQSAAQSQAQTTRSDSQTLEAILSEIRAIHEDVKVTQSTQILLTELEVQQTVVNRAQQRLDEAQAVFRDLRAGRQHAAEDLARASDKLDQTTDLQQKKQLQEEIDDSKTRIADMQRDEQERSDAIPALQQRLRDAQDALDNIQNQLDAIVKRLSPTRN